MSIRDYFSVKKGDDGSDKDERKERKESRKKKKKQGSETSFKCRINNKKKKNLNMK